MIKTLIVGFGFMGQNHYVNLKKIETDQQSVCVTGVIDSDPKKLANEKLASIADRCFTSLAEAYQGERSYDAVVMVTNTTTHYQLIKEIFEICTRQNKPLPALFSEKPLVENSEQAKEIQQILKSNGYEKSIPFTCGYLFRHSPIVEKALDYMRDNNLTIQQVKTVWQKLRDTNRPSAGVHIDEATHAVDLVLNYIFPALQLSNRQITLTVNKREYSKSIVNQELQAKLYGDDHVPLATVDYEMHVNGISIQAHTSFKEGPQRREILLECNQDTFIKLSFDENKQDTLTITSQGKEPVSISFKEPNKLLEEWKSFLEQFNQIKPSLKIPTLDEAVIDIQITEALGSAELNKPAEVILK